MVLRPKFEGAKILHERLSDPASNNALDFLIMFSFIVDVIGNLGQSNYGAVNSYLQALAQHRRACVLAASSLTPECSTHRSPLTHDPRAQQSILALFTG